MDFKSAYSRTAYIEFFRDSLLPEDYLVLSESVQIEFGSKYFKQVIFLGKCPSLDLNVYEITHSSLSDARVGLSRDAFKLIARQMENNALILFVPENADNYRLSLVTIDPKLDSEGIKILKEYSNPRRFSFSLGEGAKTHTPEQFLLNNGRITSADDLKRRFSVEVVNREFYSKIAEMFSKLVGGKRMRSNKTVVYEPMLHLPHPIDGNEQLYKEFAVRLIGRTVFCWFLKNKKSPKGIPLVPDKVLSHFAVNMMPNYYHAMVEPLFFEVLNTNISKRKKEYTEEPYKTIPFLNGGLFEPQDNDYYKGGQCDYSLNVPDAWWKEFIDILETYNFTIDENTSIDIDLSVDPEMLGRIFENLLAELNPDTDETARKSTGSFYTPRPIVEYMVDESLKQHIHTKTGIELDKLSSLLDYSQEGSALTKDEESQIKEALDTIKVLDPACGSGAYPMGVLQKMLLILQKVDNNASYSIENILKDIKDPTYRALIAEKLKDETELGDYAHKLSIIRRSIYGVDIQQIAIEISKLRFFLSLIVDEKVEDDKQNRGIEPLPNLEFKFVCANTLIPLPLARVYDNINTDDISKLEKLREEYFISFGEPKKKLIKDFGDTQKRMFEESIKALREDVSIIEDFGNSRSALLANWSPFSHEHTPWFDAKWMFGVTQGFDVVIGNPPYIQLQKDAGKLAKMYEAVKYKTFAKSGDIYCLFYEKANMLLSEKGNLCLITSNKWMRAGYGKQLRQYFLRETNPLVIIDFGDAPIFSNATTYTNILLATKKGNTTNYLQVYDLSREKYVEQNLETWLQKRKGDFASDFKEDSFLIANAQEMGIKSQIEKVGTPLKNWKADVNRGILTGFNEAFLIDNTKRNELITEDPKSAEIIKPILRGRDIKKYKISFNEIFIITTFPSLSIDIEEYPAIKKHLSSFGDKLNQTGENYIDENGEIQKSRKATGNKWFETQDQISYVNDFNKPKIIWAEIVYDSAFYFDKNCYFPEATCFILTGDSLKYITALLNSKLLTNSFKKFYAGGDLRGNTFRYKKAFLQELPLPIISEESQKPFEVLVDYVLYLHDGDKAAINEYVPNEHLAEVFEEVIDAMVFELYFKEDFANASIEFHKYALRDFKTIDGLNEPELREIIHSSYQLLRDKDNEIRNNLKLMDVRLEHIVMPIKMK